jgi:hypothetical protein
VCGSFTIKTRDKMSKEETDYLNNYHVSKGETALKLLDLLISNQEMLQAVMMQQLHTQQMLLELKGEPMQGYEPIEARMNEILAKVNSSAHRKYYALISDLIQ